MDTRSDPHVPAQDDAGALDRDLPRHLAPLTAGEPAEKAETLPSPGGDASRTGAVAHLTTPVEQVSPASPQRANRSRPGFDGTS